MKVTFKKEQSKAGHHLNPRDVTHAVFFFEDGDDIKSVGWEDDMAKLNVCPPDEALPWCAAQWYVSQPGVSRNYMSMVSKCKKAMADAMVPA